MPLHVGFVEGTDVADVETLVGKMAGTTREETGKVVELVLLQVDATAVSCHGGGRACHEIWGGVGEEEEVVHASLSGGMHKPLLTSLFAKVPRAIGRKETLGAIPCAGNLLRFAVLITASADVHTPAT